MLKSATRMVLLAFAGALVAALFLPHINETVLPTFKDALLVVFGAFFGAKGSDSARKAE